MNWWAILITAVLCAVLSCALTATWIRYRITPRLKEDLDREFQVRLEHASDVLSERVEQAVRRGVVDGFTGLASREVLEDTTRNIARSGAEFVEERLGRIFGRRR